MIIIKDEMSILQSEIDAIIEYLHNPTNPVTSYSETYSNIIVRLWGFNSFTISSPGVEGISYNSGIIYDNIYREKSRPSNINTILHKLYAEVGPFCQVHSRNAIVFQHSNKTDLVEREFMLELLINSSCIITRDKYADKYDRMVPQWAGMIIRRGSIIMPRISGTTIVFDINNLDRVSPPRSIVDLEDPQYCSIINSLLG